MISDCSKSERSSFQKYSQKNQEKHTNKKFVNWKGNYNSQKKWNYKEGHSEFETWRNYKNAGAKNEHVKNTQDEQNN